MSSQTRVSIQRTKVKAPSLIFAFWFHVILIGITVAVQKAYEVIRGPLEGELSMRQLDGTNEGYAEGVLAGRLDLSSIPMVIAVVIILAFWTNFYLRYRKYAAATVENQTDSQATE